MYRIEHISPDLAYAHLTPLGTRATNLHTGYARPMGTKAPPLLESWSRAIALALGRPAVAVCWYRSGLLVASWDASGGFTAEIPLAVAALPPAERLALLQARTIERSEARKAAWQIELADRAKRRLERRLATEARAQARRDERAQARRLGPSDGPGPERASNGRYSADHDDPPPTGPDVPTFAEYLAQVQARKAPQTPPLGTRPPTEK